MDRFIVRLEESIIRSRRNLKSNMDRFIDSDYDTHAVDISKFKIQYG